MTAKSEPRQPKSGEKIFQWTRILYTVLALIVVPSYWIIVGPVNFLWFSDIALISLPLAMWFHWRLWGSMMGVGVLPLEIIWNIDFFAYIVSGASPIGIAAYMFDPQGLLYTRILSGAFHLALPPVMITLLWRWGYDRRALKLQTLFGWIVLIATYFITSPSENINWVYGLGTAGSRFGLSQPAYFLVLMLAFPLIIYLPAHFVLSKLFRTAHPAETG